MKNSSEIWDVVEAKRQAFFDLSDRIWGIPETNYEEFRSAAEHERLLEQEGFRVHHNIAGLPTAVMGEAGEDGPVIAILGEFDALPGLSQEAGVAEERPIVAGGNGHGCGHNLLGSGSMLAAAAVKDYLAANGLKGRVRYYGCPAEEGGSSKGFMVRAGVFDDVDIAISWHPAAFTGVNNPISLACNEINFHFSGRASHASATPHLGRSALDAVELMNVGVNYMREHMPSTARIHYAVTDTGGNAPNVVQARATVRYLVRARTLPELLTLVARVKKVAEGAALMTETTVRSEVISGDANLVGNAPLEELMFANLERLGPPVYDSADEETARKFQETFSTEDIAASYGRFGLKPKKGQGLCDTVFPLGAGDGTLVGSTDVGTVSWVVPTVQMRGATYAIGTPGHSWQLVAQGKLPAAHKGMEHAAKIMASTALDLILDPARIEAAKADHKARLEDTPFVNPIPDDVEPPLPENSHG
ncbi:M20 family metallopeptidase [Agrobacterium sp. SHOUNA12C]|uniref:M20 family metallopeptidase n=1 Tax=Rhizobium rhizogenes TaxID=359 RepID=UPI0015740083|nr:M20 family metallopeptidase [Rhizobium rhizogenes]MCJ9721495.1 M20 family metallopeptidase [Agrobacterium sp. BETTINA12B]MCJ9756125.1 M20 family metallopeptidase [Agrobacterium sp. SHOUNA12C]NTF90196.1 amidohydrolase [Rhizobium rhizogenes]NTI38059.1 amidohydrolase [Rhizobium rhizogenes]WEO69492.1 M20 family metallopeptidase [Rhizobium rhizogenes]